MSKSFIDEWIEGSEENKKVFNQEQLILDTTESIWAEVEKRGWSNAQLAEALGKSRPYITQMLDGSRNMTLRTLADIATALGVHVQLSISSSQQDDGWEYGRNLFFGNVTSYINEQYCNEQEKDWTPPNTVKIA